MPGQADRRSIADALLAAGFVAGHAEAEALADAAHDDAELADMVARRLTGEPLAWVTGGTRFCGLHVAVDPGVYVPRWQSEALAVQAARLLPDDGVGVDLGTGSGAVAMVLRALRPKAHVVATEIDPVAADCARRNGVEVYVGDLDAPLPAALAVRVDVMVGVLPYVPLTAVHLLPRDVRDFEPSRALVGGGDGLGLVKTAVVRSGRWLAAGGWLALEVGSPQAGEVAALFEQAGFVDVDTVVDGDGDARGVVGRRI